MEKKNTKDTDTLSVTDPTPADETKKKTPVRRTPAKKKAPRTAESTKKTVKKVADTPESTNKEEHSMTDTAPAVANDGSELPVKFSKDQSTSDAPLSDKEQDTDASADGQLCEEKEPANNEELPDSTKNDPPLSEEELEKRSIESLSGHERVLINENIRLFEPDVKEKPAVEADASAEISAPSSAEDFVRFIRPRKKSAETENTDTDIDADADANANADADADADAHTDTDTSTDEAAAPAESSVDETDGIADTDTSPTDEADDQSSVEDTSDTEEQVQNQTDSEPKDEHISESEDGTVVPSAASEAHTSPAAPTESAPRHHGQDKPKEHQKHRRPFPKKKLPRYIDGLFDFVELFVFTLVAVLTVTAFLFRHSVVDGDSMVGTLHDGENLIISNLFYEPKPGDIIVFEDHGTDLSVPVVKRIIATEGQKVRVTATDIIVDGITLDESSYAYFSNGKKAYNPNPSKEVYNTERYPDFNYVPDTYYEFTVPQGELFVLGDNRNISHDSRAFGTIKEDSVFGRVLLRFYPFDKFGTVD